MKISFMLTGEGTSDLRLQSHIENVLIGEGFTEVDGESPDLGAFVPNVGHTVKEKLRALVKHYPNVDVIFYHRDADGVGLPARQQEIAQGSEGVMANNRVIPLIPARMLETWLLADPAAIAVVAGMAGATARLACLPSFRRLEGVADAKSLLRDALCEASQTQGGQLAKFKKRFNEMRARLTTDLDPDGPVNRLPSYQEFRRRIKEFAQIKINAQ
jgi:hypothetical protein